MSLQKSAAGGNPAQLAGFHMLDVMDRVDDFADTAALVANLDLVISVDTRWRTWRGGSGVRCGCCRVTTDAGAGCTGVMTPRGTPRCEFIPQERPLDWNGVVARVRRDLLALAAPRDTGREIVRAVG